MKILNLTLFLYFSLFAACDTYAANTSLISNYPAPSGSYNQIVITPQTGATGTAFTCASQSDVGQLFYNTTTNILQLCADVGTAPGTPTMIASSNQTCFNRFCCAGTNCNTICSTTANLTNATTCPAGYIKSPIVDNFSNTIGANTYTVYTTACCSSTVIQA